MSSSGRNDVTSSPNVGIVHTIAMMIAKSEATGEAKKLLAFAFDAAGLMAVIVQSSRGEAA
jgi:hypothetical protein